MRYNIRIISCIGIAISSDGTMYLADGTNIRVVNRHGIIHTLIGHHKHNNIWQPMPCKTAMPTSQVCVTYQYHYLDKQLTVIFY